MLKPITARACVALCLIAGSFLFCMGSEAQAAGMEKPLRITVQVLDGRNGKPLKDQHLLVFTGPSIDAVRSHAEHTGLTTDKWGVGTLMIYPSETQWIQVFADGRILCYRDPNQNSFNVGEIMARGVVTPNDCSALIRQPRPGHLIVFARPAHFLEKMKR